LSWISLWLPFLISARICWQTSRSARSNGHKFQITNFDVRNSGFPGFDFAIEVCSYRRENRLRYSSFCYASPVDKHMFGCCVRGMFFIANFLSAKIYKSGLFPTTFYRISNRNENRWIGLFIGTCINSFFLPFAIITGPEVGWVWTRSCVGNIWIDNTTVMSADRHCVVLCAYDRYRDRVMRNRKIISRDWSAAINACFFFEGRTPFDFNQNSTSRFDVYDIQPPAIVMSVFGATERERMWKRTSVYVSSEKHNYFKILF
jgi:hypothetical protein